MLNSTHLIDKYMLSSRFMTILTLNDCKPNRYKSNSSQCALRDHTVYYSSHTPSYFKDFYPHSWVSRLVLGSWWLLVSLWWAPHIEFWPSIGGVMVWALVAAGHTMDRVRCDNFCWSYVGFILISLQEWGWGRWCVCPDCSAAVLSWLQLHMLRAKAHWGFIAECHLSGKFLA